AVSPPTQSARSVSRISPTKTHAKPIAKPVAKKKDAKKEVATSVKKAAPRTSSSSSSSSSISYSQNLNMTVYKKLPPLPNPALFDNAPLHRLAFRGDITPEELRKTLEAMKANGTLKEELDKIVHGWTAIEIFLYKGNLSLVRIFLSYGPNVKAIPDDEQGDDYYSPFQIAAASKGLNQPEVLDVVKTMIKLGASVNGFQCHNGKYREAPHLMAAFYGNHHFLNALGESGADLGTYDYSGFAAIHLLAFQGHDEAIKNFWLVGNYIDYPTEEVRCSPVSIAANIGHSSTVDCLLELGANTKKGDRDD
ncbi:MAG TPA: ankyrin repeat domain-containing protein, partial [Chlamydiales bacterium]|nr:ankyrin repeat domain-containing protein [Chlamydiales bacterium]